MLISKFTETSAVSIANWHTTCGPMLSNLNSVVTLAQKRSIVKRWLGREYEKILNRDDNPAIGFQLKDAIVGNVKARPRIRGEINCKPFAAIALTNETNMSWSWDPYKSLTWQMGFQSCYWLPFAYLGSLGDEYGERLSQVWTSFQGENRYPRKMSNMTFEDNTCAARLEAALLCLYGNVSNDLCRVNVPSLRLYSQQHSELFDTLMYQLYVDSSLLEQYLRGKMYRIHNHNIMMACSLLCMVDAFGGCEFAKKYKEMAVDVIMAHVENMFESDGFIREQSTKYHQYMTLYMMKVYSRLRAMSCLSSEQDDYFKQRLQQWCRIDALLRDGDGVSLSMGDGAKTKDEVPRKLKELDLADCLFVGETNRVVLPQSGLYMYRNLTRDTLLAIDVSANVKAHGHYDLGSWQYIGEGVEWVSDLGGPYKYGTKLCRQLRLASAHTLVMPRKREQSSGVAKIGKESFDEDGVNLEFRSNVFGADLTHMVGVRANKELNRVCVLTKFKGTEKQDFVGRVMLGKGVTPTLIDEINNIWRLDCAYPGKRRFLRIAGAESGDTKVVVRQGSTAEGELEHRLSLEYVMQGSCECVSKVILDRTVKGVKEL